MTSLAADPELIVSEETGSVGETVEVYVSTMGNPGFNAASLFIVYDNTALKLKSAVLDEAYSSCTPSLDNLPYITFYGPKDITQDGIVLKLEFGILDNAELQVYAVTVSYEEGDIANLNEKDVNFKVIAGSITVVEPHCKHPNTVVLPAVPASCTESGLTEGLKCTDCGEIIIVQEIVQALGHNYTSVVTPPTCTEKGFTTYTCSRCNDSYTANETPASGHKWGKWIQTTAPGCVTHGVETRNCSTCRATETRDVAALGHSYSSVIIQPTCTEKGKTIYTCSVCKQSYEEEIAAKGHDYKEVVIQAQCEEKGCTKKVCNVCGDEVIINETSALGHEYGKWTVSTEATCTQMGTETHTCARCGFEETRGIPAVGHSYKDETVAATCTQNGYSKHTCKTCGISYTDAEVPALGHDYKVTQTTGDCVNGSDTKYTCSRCGDVKTEHINGAGHAYERTVKKQPDCEESGIAKYTCTRCGESYTEKIDALGHSYDAKVTVPTCTSVGYTTYTCTRCGKTYKGDETPFAEHQWNNWTETKAPTCETNGVEMHSCFICNKTETRDVSSLGHKYNPTVVPPTCIEKGYTTYTCFRCGNTYNSNEIEPLGHNYIIVDQKEPSETEAGFIKYDCTRCHNQYTEDVLPLNHTHDLMFVAAKAASHFENGNSAYYVCSSCGKCFSDNQGENEISLESTVVPKVEHSYAQKSDENNHWLECSCGDVKDTEKHLGGKATCAHKAICEVCGKEYGSLDKSAHEGNPELRDKKEASYDEEGYTGDIYCSICGEKMSSGMIIPKKADTVSEMWQSDENEHWLVYVGSGKDVTGTRQAHIESDWVVTLEPTETDYGSRQKVCAVCGKIISKEQLSPTGFNETNETNSFMLYVVIGIVCAVALIAGISSFLIIKKKRHKNHT